MAAELPDAKDEALTALVERLVRAEPECEEVEVDRDG